MNGDGPGAVQRLWHASVLLLGAAIALYIAACLLLSIWPVLAVIGLVVTSAGVAVAVWRHRRERW
jgi:hypothetical protein